MFCNSRTTLSAASSTVNAARLRNMDYKEKREAQRSQAINRITDIMEENGLFD